MASDGDPHPHTPGDPYSMFHSHTPSPTDPHEEEKASRISMKRRLRKVRREAAALELEQGPSELHKEDPGTTQARQISTPGAPAGSHGHPKISVLAPTNSGEKEEWGAITMTKAAKLEAAKLAAAALKKEERRARKKVAKLAAAARKELEQGPRELGFPQVRQISPSGAPEIPAGSHGHPEAMGMTKSAALKLEAWGHRLLNTARLTWSPAPQGARVHHSFLYSGRPRQSKRSTTGKIPVEENVGEVSSREFEALTLDQSPPKPDSTHRSTGTTISVRQSALYSSRLRQSRGRQEQEPSENKPLSKECDTANSERELEVVVEESKDESDCDSEEEWRKFRAYKDRMFDKDFAPQSATQAAASDKNSAVEHVTEYSAVAEWAKRSYLTWRKSLLVCSDAQHTMVVSSSDEPMCEVSDDDIVQNGNKWMSEEVMVAFDEYIGRIDELKELKYCFQELCHQCFNVECYFKIFHHFNFTVNTKLPGSDDWKLKTYFAEVKEIFGKKFYFCCPLEEDENGRCHACSNQGVDKLRHPATGGFERGLPDSVFPYM